LGTLIEPESETFTLNEIFKMNIISYADAVREVCEVAREEFKIEHALDKIEKRWISIELDMEVFKKTYKVRKPEEIFTVLEDHMATLSA
jgi:dynein heavy chain